MVDTVRRAFFALTVVGSSTLLGCASTSPAKTPPQPDDANEESPEPNAKPTAPKETILETEDLRVRVATPHGADWQCVRRWSLEQGYAFVQCEHTTAEGKLMFMAKDYEVDEAQVATAEELAKVIYPRHYQKRWDTVSYESNDGVERCGKQGFRAVIALAKDDVNIQVIEEVYVVGTHTVNLSATGPKERFEALAAEVTRWFAKATFNALCMP